MKSSDLLLSAAALLVAVVVLGRVFGSVAGKTLAAPVEVAIEEIQRSNR